MSLSTAPLLPISSLLPPLFRLSRLSRLPLLVLLPALAVLAGCASPAPIHKGEAQAAPLTSSEVAQSDTNRMATLGMRDNIESLLRLVRSQLEISIRVLMRG